MRRWQSIAGALGLLAIGAACWCYLGRIGDERDPMKDRVAVQNDGNAEPSEVIEPLIVEGGLPPMVETREPPLAEPAPVLFEQGMRLPPRPDADADHPLHMPYAVD